MCWDDIVIFFFGEGGAKSHETPPIHHRQLVVSEACGLVFSQLCAAPLRSKLLLRFLASLVACGALAVEGPLGFGPAVGKARSFVPLESDSDDDAPASRSAPRDKTSKRVERKKKAQKDKVALTPYFPASSGILGASLGLEPPSGACKHCQGTGHFHSECPVYWAKRGHPLPGFTSSGRRVRSAWDDDNPKKEVFAAWVKFWKDKSIFENGPAVRDGAPDLAALKKASREGPPP